MIWTHCFPHRWMDLENTHTSIPIPFSIDHSLYFFVYILRRVHVDGKFMGMKNKLVDYTHTPCTKQRSGPPGQSRLSNVAIGGRGRSFVIRAHSSQVSDRTDLFVSLHFKVNMDEYTGECRQQHTHTHVVAAADDDHDQSVGYSFAKGYFQGGRAAWTVLDFSWSPTIPPVFITRSIVRPTPLFITRTRYSRGEDTFLGLMCKSVPTYPLFLCERILAIVCHTSIYTHALHEALATIFTHTGDLPTSDGAPDSPLCALHCKAQVHFDRTTLYFRFRHSIVASHHKKVHYYWWLRYGGDWLLDLWL